MLSVLYKTLTPALFLIPPEAAHGLTVKCMSWGIFSSLSKFSGVKVSKDDEKILEVNLWNRKFPNPIGMAAGFDKNAQAVSELMRLGFGHVEAGTVTPRPQSGNPKPRIFREPKTKSVINRMGFPGIGMSEFKRNLEAQISKTPRQPGVIGINIGMNKGQRDIHKEYCTLIRNFAPLADYIAINISSPNTPGLRDLQAKENLVPLLEAILAERDKSSGKLDLPVLVKLAPDLDEKQQKEIADSLMKVKIDGIILTNTSLERPQELPEKISGETGGLSGGLITDKSTEIIRNFYKLTGGSIPIIGVGGVFTGEDAYKKIRAGASLVQIYTSIVYRGPYVASLINEELKQCLKNDGFNSVSEAVGADHKK